MIAAALLYAAAVVWLTWPLATRLATHLPNTHPACNFDLLQTAWVLAHESRALTQPGVTLADAPIYHPTPGALYYADAAFGALPLYLPTFLLTGNPTLAVNLTFLASTVLTALALHAVVRGWTSSHPAGAVAGWTFLTTRWTLWEFAPSAPQYAVLPWFPFVILVATRPSSWRRSVALGILVAVQSLSSPVYVSAALLVPLAILAAFRLARRGHRADGLGLVAALALAVALLMPVVWGYVAVRMAHPDLAQQSYWRWWHPTSELPWGPFAAPGEPTAVPLLALGLAIAGIVSIAVPWRARASPVAPRVLRHAVFWALTGLVLGLAPAATWYGRPIRMPQTILAEWVPLYGTLRESFRLGIAGLMGLSLAAGLGFALVVSRLPTSSRTAVLAATIVAFAVGGEMYREYRAPGPFGREALPPLYPLLRPPAVDDPIVRAIAGRSGPLLEVPIGLTIYGPLPGYQAQAMYRAIFHRRPLLNGYGGYWPDGFIARMLRATALPAPDALAFLRRETGLTTVVVNADHLEPAEAASWQRRLDDGMPGLELRGRFGEGVVLDVAE